jgi:hypothetical protein
MVTVCSVSAGNHGYVEGWYPAAVTDSGIRSGEAGILVVRDTGPVEGIVPAAVLRESWAPSMFVTGLNVGVYAIASDR